MILRALQNILPPADTTDSIDLTTHTLQEITEGALYDHIKPIANDTVTAFKNELKLTEINDAPGTVTDKIKINTIETQQKEIATTDEHLDYQSKEIRDRQQSMDTILSSLNLTVTDIPKSNTHDTVFITSQLTKYLHH